MHTVLHGGVRDDPAAVWAAAHGLPEPPLPAPEGTLLDAWGSPAGTSDGPLRPDGQLDPSWPHEPERWAALAAEVQALQEAALRALPDPRALTDGPPLAVITAWAESAAAVLCTELQRDGLPLSRAVADELLVELLGDGTRATRDAPVLALLPDEPVDLRNPASVLEALQRRGIEVKDTRSWRLEPYRAAHPLVDALLVWRKAERIATTYGPAWLDACVVGDRLRGPWSSADGGAGRMTAGNGLHNLPAELRRAVVADPGHVFVRADLGQVEPRVLAAVSGDRALAAAARDDDMYTPVAVQLGVDRPTAKVAVLAAMYGQTSGAAGRALQSMERTYPVALGLLRDAEEAGRVGRPVRTHGGRLVLSGTGGHGRYVRNAVVQGAAAELFKAWTAAVRTLLPDGRIVLCLHDELLLHVPTDEAPDAVRVLHTALTSTSAVWAAGSGVRFVADVAVVERWSDAKG